MKSKELLKGCGKRILIDERGFYGWCGTNRIKPAIGEDMEHDSIIYCFNCKAKQSERLNCYREDLEFLEVKMFDFMNINGTCFRIMSERINFLKQEIKDLEGEK